ncbi:transposase [Paenibacillus polymyxa]|uniref:transposase n=1 Tax=Paenibacillus polymyxa TaxID=1406 RepID=UPI003C7B9C4F
MRRRYELTDREWDVFAPSTKITRRATTQKRRQMLNAVLWGARTGAPWRDLPDYYGPWSSVYSFFWRPAKGRHLG